MSEKVEDTELRNALALVAHALGMDETEAFSAPMRFAIRAQLKIYGLRDFMARHGPQDPRAA